MDAGVSVELFVEILNRYVYYFDQENEAVCSFTLHALTGMLISTGYDEILEWPDRTHPFQPQYQRKHVGSRESTTSFPEDVGLH